ncbi:dihydrofolate synthase / folylpolyglutamate synthase [Pseudidiomarina indica]|uniref:Dihydrofolate synthase/folylpolyglutamate synthase n=1 Tax=Pseudidiomarina indica TaxID=1159017 RepID=A0A1G6DSC6_9GAMM|nr:bifunctional tetrahydrofolate synthase/dihydrofolate synthase [Pseudidiomarina indica]SDB48049.1 dihydrofolate synthase / folylpolyglutamate synthase [Pseudidiomarina indica]
MSALQAPSATASLDDWLSYLEQLHPSAIDMGLERIKTVADRLQLTTTDAQVFTVAGTNGKGSTVRYLETILECAGYRTGVYVSPHLHHYTERVRISGQCLTDAEHVAAFAAIEAVRGEVSLTYFEFGTLAALWLLRQHKLDAWVLEVGLGGRLDAVNIVDADVGIITSIGIDHIGFLGSDRTGIAREKAGVFRSQRPAIVGEPDFPAAVVATAQEQGIPLQRVGHDFFYRITGPTSWEYRDSNHFLQELPLPQLPLPNAATAVAALAACRLPIAAQAIRDGLAGAREAGRLEWRPGNGVTRVDTLLDVAHNPHAANFLVQAIQARYPTYRIFAVVGMLEDKDIAGTLTTLAPAVDAWYFASLSVARGSSAEQLADHVAAEVAEKVPVRGCFASVLEAYQQAQQDALATTGQPILVLVCGSFYTVGQIPDSE